MANAEEEISSIANMLVCGDVKGQFRALFDKVKQVIKRKDSIEALYCVGNFFSDSPNDNQEYEDLIAGKIHVPATTWILNGNQSSFKELYEPLHKSVPEIKYLGKMGCITTTTGLKIAYLSGVEMPGNISDQAGADTSLYSPYFTRDLVTSLLKTAGTGTVVLLTSVWPNLTIKTFDEEQQLIVNNCSSELVSYLAEGLKPSYHIAGMAGVNYESCNPKRSDVEEKQPGTKFVALGYANNKRKQKWMFAYQYISVIQSDTKISDDSTDHLSPSNRKIFNELEHKNWRFFHETVKNTNFFFDVNPCSSSASKHKMEHSYEKMSKKPALDASTCWFCMSNPDVDRDLIIKIGDHCYITLAKGVLVPEHVFIVPINHISSCVKLCSEAFEEVEKFKEALVKYFHEKNKDVVFFERNFRSPHLQIQAVPIPKNLEKSIEEIFSEFGFKITYIPSSTNIREVLSGESKDYFYLEITINKNAATKCVTFIEKSEKKFPLQIGRSIIAEALNIKNRISWMECQDSKAEKTMAAEMRNSFKKIVT